MNIRGVIAFIRVLSIFSVRDACANDLTIWYFAGKRGRGSTALELNNAFIGKRSRFYAD